MNVSNPSGLKSLMPSLAPWVYLELKEGEWLLVAPSGTTTEEVSGKLGFNEKGTDTALILRVETYYGRNYSKVWEWIKTKRGAIFDTAAPIEG